MKAVRGTGCNRNGFTLLELSAVLLIIALVTGMAISSGMAVTSSARQAATEKKMEIIKSSLQSYRVTYDRLPCPASLTIAEGSANYGIEAANPGACIGGSPAANYGSTAVEGTLPVITLGLPRDFMYDGWGNRFRYAVDKQLTAVGGFKSSPSACVNGAITINDGFGNPRSSGAIYALISAGKNGHGGFTPNGVVMNAASVNADELTNCHCTASAAPGTYSAIYVQKDVTSNPANAFDIFDDLVAYKERWQMMSAYEKVQKCSYIFVTDGGNNRVEKFDTNGNYISQFGSSGSGNGQFSNPMGIAYDSSSDSLYVADQGNSRVEKFDSSGNYLLSFGTAGAGNGQFYDPTDIAVDNSGNVWITEDFYNNRVQKFDKNGNWILTIGGTASGSGNGQFNFATGIEISSDNYVYVGDNGNHRIQKFNTTGTYLSQFTMNPVGDVPWLSLGIDSSGNIYVPNDSHWQYAKFNSVGTFLMNAGGYGSGNGQFMGPPNLTVDANNNIWVVDFGNWRVQKFDTSGNYVMQFGSQGTGNGQFSNSMNGIAVTSR